MNGFNIKFDEYKQNNQVNTTLAQQLALYIVIYSPIQMAADLVEYYEANLEPLQCIKDGENAHWNDNPLDIKIEKMEINKNSKLILNLVEGRGFAISLKKK